MKKVIFRILSFILALLVGVSCSEELVPTPNTYSKILTGETSKSWKLEAISLEIEGKADQTFELPNNCVYDDYYVFYANSERLFEVDEGGSKCAPEDPEIYLTDNWSLVNANATLTFVFPVLAEVRLPYIVNLLTDDKMILEIFFNEDKSNYRMVFKKVSEN